MNYIGLKKLTILAVLIFSTTNCSSGPKISEFSTSASSAEEIDRLSADLKDAENSQANVLAPESFKNAHKHLENARRDQKNAKSDQDILHQVTKGRAYLDQAKRAVDLSNSKIQEVVQARQSALSTGANKHFSGEFTKADKNLTDLTEEIEENDFDSIENERLKLLSQYKDLELKGILKNSLGPARETLDKALLEGAEEHASQSLAITKQTINDTEAFIIANREQTQEVENRAAEASAKADHLLKITRSAKVVDNSSPEDAALRLEASNIKLRQERAAMKKVSKESTRLKSEEEFNNSFKKAQSIFSKDEAEIYRQQDRLVIRLKALEFPVGQATLRESNYEVLGKVSDVIKGFDDPKVVVEGHTDSDGGPQLNKKLSLERSQSVSAYFVSANAVDPDQISAVGYGFEKPLATNKNPSGKAQNRRVDIVITPSSERGSL